MTTTKTPAQRKAQLEKLRSDPAAFRRALIVDADSGPQRLDTIANDWQRRDFEALDSGWRAVAGHKLDNPTLRAWLERPRGHSKTTDLAVMVAWVLFASAKRINGIIAAADLDQAKLLRDAVIRLLGLNPWLAQFLDVQTSRIVNKHTDSEAVFITSDVASSFGLLIDFAILDETTHWANRDLFDSLLSAAAKKQRCMVVSIANAGFMDSWAWTVREAVRIDPAWHFSRLDGPRATWITAERLAEQRRLLPDIVYRRLWLNVWSGGSGDAIHPDDLTAAITMRVPMLAAEPGFAFVAGVDLSVTRDATALVTLGVNVGWIETRPPRMPNFASTVAKLSDAGLLEAPRQDPERIRHPGNGRVRLASLRVWEPCNGSRVDLSEVEAAIIDLHKRLNLSAVAVDPFQAEMLVQRLQRKGIPIYTLSMTGITLQAMASAVTDVFREKSVDLYPDDQLLADLRGLRIADRNYGFRLVSPRATRMDTHATQHGDTATGFSLAMLAAKRAALHPGREVPGRLVCWPEAPAA
jgi:phage terminase large subunit-like protein